MSKDVPTDAAATTPAPKRGSFQGSLSVGTVLVAVFVIVAILGPWLAPADPMAIDLPHQYEPPSARAWLGTGDNGVDVLSALVHGARLALAVGLCVTAISLIIGTTVGLLAGYRGGIVDHALTGVMDVLQSFPSIILQIALVALVPTPGFGTLVFALSATGWVLFARLTRAEVLTLKQRDFVQAAVALGASQPRVLFRHLLPNLAGPLVIQASAGFSSTILAEATLSFLGLGPSDQVSWGAMLEQGSAVLLRFPHVALASGAAIAITVLGFNLAGDTLRDRLSTPR